MAPGSGWLAALRRGELGGRLGFEVTGLRDPARWVPTPPQVERWPPPTPRYEEPRAPPARAQSPVVRRSLVAPGVGSPREHTEVPAVERLAPLVRTHSARAQACMSARVDGVSPARGALDPTKPETSPAASHVPSARPSPDHVPKRIPVGASHASVCPLDVLRQPCASLRSPSSRRWIDWELRAPASIASSRPGWDGRTSRSPTPIEPR